MASDCARSFAATGAFEQMLVQAPLLLSTERSGGRYGTEFQKFVMGFAWPHWSGSSAGAIFYHFAHFVGNFAEKICFRIFSRPR